MAYRIILVNFADDTKHLKNTYLNANKNLNIEIKEVSGWLMVNKFKLNLNKTKIKLLHLV